MKEICDQKSAQLSNLELINENLEKDCCKQVATYRDQIQVLYEKIDELKQENKFFKK